MLPSKEEIHGLMVEYKLLFFEKEINYSSKLLEFFFYDNLTYIIHYSY